MYIVMHNGRGDDIDVFGRKIRFQKRDNDMVDLIGVRGVKEGVSEKG